MKTPIHLLLWSFLCMAACLAQQETHSIENGEGFNKRTQDYEARAPYTLKWQVSKFSEIKDDLGQTRRFDTRGVEILVCDAATRKILVKTGPQPLEGQVAVPVAGKHYLRIFTNGKWNTWYVVDTAAISAEQARKAAAARKAAQSQNAGPQHVEIDDAPPHPSPPRPPTKPSPPLAPAKPSSTPGLPAGMELGK